MRVMWWLALGLISILPCAGAAVAAPVVTTWCALDSEETGTTYVCFDDEASWVCLLYYQRDERYDMCTNLPGAA